MNERTEPMSLQHPESSRLSREQGHEFNNIFSVIIANVEMVGEELGATGQVRRLERTMEAGRVSGLSRTRLYQSIKKYSEA